MTLNDKRREDHSLLPSDPLFRELKLLKVQDIYKLRISKFIFNCLNNTNPSIFLNWFNLTSSVHRYNTRSKHVNTDNNTVTRTLFIPFARNPRASTWIADES